MIAEMVTSATLKDWILCLVISLLILWKVWPDISNRVKGAFNTARYGADLVDMVEEHELAINGAGGIQEKLERDYDRINKLESKAKISLEENELIMKSMLAILKVMNKMEPSEDTEQVQEEIVEFMNRQSHRE